MYLRNTIFNPRLVSRQTTSEPKYYSEKAKHGPQLYRTTDEVGRLRLLIVQIAMILARDRARPTCSLRLLAPVLRRCFSTRQGL
jgi:hypothetical protein